MQLPIIKKILDNHCSMIYIKACSCFYAFDKEGNSGNQGWFKKKKFLFVKDFSSFFFGPHDIL